MAKRVLSLCLLAVVAGGCVSTSNPFQTAIMDTHRRVVNLESNLQGSVTKLGETTGNLLTRVNESDEQLRNVQSVLDENQARLNDLQTKFDSLTNAIYREQGRTLLPGAPSGVPPVNMTPGAIAPSGATEVAPGAAPGMAATPADPASPAPGAVPEQAMAGPETLQPVSPAPQAPAAAPAASNVVSSGSQDVDYQQAQKSYARQDYGAALDQFGAFLQNYPLSQYAQNAMFWRAKSFQSLERYEEAIAEYNRLRDAYPVGAGGNLANSKVPHAMHQQAFCHARLGQTERAIDLLQQVIRDFPTSPAADQAKSDLKRLQ